MNIEFWRRRWEQNEIGFHEAKPNRLLLQFGERLRVTATPRVLVPLCGKSTDLAWLAAHGFRVTGVEAVRQAAAAFFEENQLSTTTATWHGFEQFAGERLEILVGDFFALDPSLIPPFDAVYDRAALIAVRPEEREPYVMRLLELLRPGGRLLLVNFAYDQAVMGGPPFSLDEAEVRRLFGSRCTLELLADEDILDNESRFRQRGLTWLREQAWLITP
jgi:thiopurine S-methyltransferase